jgi:hypothetical protein
MSYCKLPESNLQGSEPPPAPLVPGHRLHTLIHLSLLNLSAVPRYLYTCSRCAMQVEELVVEDTGGSQKVVVCLHEVRHSGPFPGSLRWTVASLHPSRLDSRPRGGRRGEVRHSGSLPGSLRCTVGILRCSRRPGSRPRGGRRGEVRHSGPSPGSLRRTVASLHPSRLDRSSTQRSFPRFAAVYSGKRPVLTQTWFTSTRGSARRPPFYRGTC